MLGFSVSQATVSRYVPARSRPPGAIVADLSSQSSHGLRSQRVFRGAVRGETLAHTLSSVGPSSSDRGCADCDDRYGAQARAWASTARPEAIEELVCVPLSAIAQCRIALPPYPAAHEERYMIVPGRLSRSEVLRDTLDLPRRVFRVSALADEVLRRDTWSRPMRAHRSSLILAFVRLLLHWLPEHKRWSSKALRIIGRV